MRYIVKSVVCDYGVFGKTDNEEKLIDICNSKSNAELIADILNTDLQNERYEVVKKSKADNAIEELRKEIEDNHLNVIKYADGEWIVKDFVYGAIERFKRNIGE